MDELPIEKNQTNGNENKDVFRATETSNIMRDSFGNPNESRSSDEEDAPKTRSTRNKKRDKCFSDSDSDSGREKTKNGELSGSEDNSQLLESKLSDASENDRSVSKSLPHKSRIKINSNLSDSGSDTATKNEEQQYRISNKRKKLQDKFKSLVTSRRKEPPSDEQKSFSESDEEMASIEKIKQKIKERMSFMPSICDPDTTDEENSLQKPAYKQKKERKRTKLTSPKPQRMSAKQAMENMQKIKSESNRMLREKEVSLPYHRPKALSLKDIMSRRKLAVSSDGKALPIKMNGEQLKQYAQMLEERQKEMMELCKSESEEEEANENPLEINSKIAANEESNTNPEETISTENGTISDLNNYVNDTMLNKDSYTENTGHECYDVSLNDDQLPKEQESVSSMELVYNDSVNLVIDDKLSTDKEASNTVLETDTENISIIPKIIEKELVPGETVICENEIVDKNKDSLISNTEVEVDSQLISLHFDTENTDKTIEQEVVTENIIKPIENNVATSENNLVDQNVENSRDDYMEVNNEFSDDDINLEDIDNIIENAEIIKDIEDKVNSQFLVRDKPLNLNPKLTGAPGMVIDLDGGPEPRKTGVELLRERFTYFSNLKTAEEVEREREKKLKPGTQLNKLKQELEEKIAEQRSLEWAKRLEDEKQQQKELQVLRGEESDEDDIDKIEAAIEDKEEVNEEPEKSESEEEPIEDDVVIKDKPRSKNAMVDDEAEESDCDEAKNDNVEDDGEENEGDDGVDADNDDEENESETDESESSESEEEHVTTKKGRILKAFEDSDEEDATKPNPSAEEIKEVNERSESKNGSKTETFVENPVASQDEELQLAQRQKSMSDDLFTSQESDLIVSELKEKPKSFVDSDEAFTQTFSILDSSKQAQEIGLDSSIKLSAACTTQSLEVGSLDDITTMCPVTESQDNLPLPSQIPMTQPSQSQPIGEDIVALCTGQFYNNQFISQVEENQIPLGESQKYDSCDDYPSQESQEEHVNVLATSYIGIGKEKVIVTDNIETKEAEHFIELNGLDGKGKNKVVDDNLKSILDELGDPEFDEPKPNKFFANKNIKNSAQQNEAQVKKKLVIDSDDETNEAEATDTNKRKKLKKKKPEKRALQFSDDEEELSEVEEIESNESDIEEDNPERLVEYDSEENEIVIKPQNPKKKRKMAEFFENEAELTSEDEWVGSGDEDEAGLDRMEREEGDDDKFHQGKLQRELEQIHMRDVLDQDKREVRLIQELLFEDGDLGAGSRQRKFRWNNIDGEVETGTVPDEFGDTQGEEAESEEQWRKQRHEREMFLKQLQNKEDPDEGLNVSISRTTIIKANLLSKTMSSVLMDANNSNTEKTESPLVERKTAKDIPSPKKPFSMLQQSYQGSLLSRGRGALARLAALATPLATDDDAVGTLGPTSKRNFVFAAITPNEKVPKVKKRKAESNSSTPNLLKKMRKEDKQITSKNSLLDHFTL